AVCGERVDRAPPDGQLRACVGGEDLLPAVVALERRKAGGAREELRLVVEALLLRRRRQQLGERPGRRRGGTEAPREQIRDVGVVAAEELVAPLAGERALPLLRGEPRHEVRRECRRVGERLVERRGERRQE